MNCSLNCREDKCAVLDGCGQCESSNVAYPQWGDLVWRLIWGRWTEGEVVYVLVSDSLYGIVNDIRSYLGFQKPINQKINVLASEEDENIQQQREDSWLFYGISKEMREGIIKMQQSKESWLKKVIKKYKHCFIWYNNLTEEGKAYFASIWLVDKYFLINNERSLLLFTSKWVFVFSSWAKKFIRSLESKWYEKLVREIGGFNLAAVKLLFEIKDNKLSWA